MITAAAAVAMLVAGVVWLAGAWGLVACGAVLLLAVMLVDVKD